MTLPRLILLFTLLASLTATVQAQVLTPANESDPYPLRPAERDPKWVIKFAPLTLFDPDNTVQVGVERLLGQQHAVQVEMGYGWQGINLWQNSQNRRYSDREVWRGRAEYRYYFNRADAPVGPYVAAEGFYKQVNARESGTTGIGCGTNDATFRPCQYYRMFTSPVSKNVWGGHIKIGRQFSISPDDRLLIDIYTGLGFRRSNVERFGRPSGVYYYGSAGYSLFDAFSPQTYAVLSVAYGFKIGYSL